MMALLFFNGQYLDNSQPIFTAESRAVKYGDGCFESMSLFKNKVPLLENHILRLIRAAQTLQMQLPTDFSLKNVAEIISFLSH